MSRIIPFDFESHAVRSVMIDGAPWFVAADVCRVLELTQVTRAVSALDAHQVQKIDLNTIGLTEGIQANTLTSSKGIPAKNRGNPTALIVSEGGLYKLTMRSKAAVTPGTVQHRFANWVVDFLLPTLRAQGYYAMPGVAAPDLEELAERRVYFEDLPEEQKEMSRRRVAALIKIDDAVKEGVRVSHALREVAAEMGWSHSTLWSYRRATFAVPRCDWDVACAPGWRRRAGGCGSSATPRRCGSSRGWWRQASRSAPVTGARRRLPPSAAGPRCPPSTRCAATRRGFCPPLKQEGVFRHEYAARTQRSGCRQPGGLPRSAFGGGAIFFSIASASARSAPGIRRAA